METQLNSTPIGISKLENLLDQTNAEVLIIDPWRLWLNGDENNAEDVVRGLKSLSGIRKTRPALTIIVVHHIRKERFEAPTTLVADPSRWVENISGHYALVGQVDACYGLERHDCDGEERVVFGGIARNVEPRTILLNDDPESLRFDVAATEEAMKITMTRKEYEYWLKAKYLKRFTWSSFVASTGVTNKKTLSSMLKKAQGHGLIQRSEREYVIIGG